MGEAAVLTDDDTVQIYRGIARQAFERELAGIDHLGRLRQFAAVQGTIEGAALALTRIVGSADAAQLFESIASDLRERADVEAATQREL